jgi:aspartate racemase
MLGILGGMGPLASADFFAKLIAETPARRDADHVPVLLLSDPRIPPRPPAILDGAESPLPVLCALRDRLVAAGATLLAMPCNTAHFWYLALAQGTAVPFISIVEAACDAVDAIAPAPASVGLIATRATLVSRIYEAPLAARGHRALFPETHEQSGGIAPAIEHVKCGDARGAARLLVPVIESLLARGADAVILACTEMPIALDAVDAPVRARCVDANRALARRCVAAWHALA